MPNQNPEQKARDNIDDQLKTCGWDVQSKSKINLNAKLGVAVREYQTDVGPADYVLFVNGKPVGVIEAKREEEGHKLKVHEDQVKDYAEAKLKYLKNNPLPFVYLSTGKVTSFTDFRDPKPRARNVFTFHRPITIHNWLKKTKSLRGSLLDLNNLDKKGLRDCQINAIINLEKSYKLNKPRALVQMATGSGKTLMAVNLCNELIEKAKAKRILFLVDRKNLGKQTLQEFQNFEVPGDGRKFTELYNVNRLTSNKIKDSDKVCIATIQRVYSMLMNKVLDESEEDKSGFDESSKLKPLEVKYNSKIPIETFDFIIVDE